MTVRDSLKLFTIAPEMIAKAKAEARAEFVQIGWHVTDPSNNDLRGFLVHDDLLDYWKAAGYDVAPLYKRKP
jgi:hypothetical protein